MGKMNQKKGNKHPKIKKIQPLKVVYISNPIKFKASASEFMALVQELTGQDADTPESPTFTAEDGGEAAAAKVVADEDNAHAGVEKEVGEMGHHTICYGEVGQVGSDPEEFGSFDDLFLCQEMIENLQGHFVGSNLVDVLKNLDAM